MREQLKKWFNAGCCVISIAGTIYLSFHLAALGWYNGKATAELQDNVRILDAYIKLR